MMNFEEREAREVILTSRRSLRAAVHKNAYEQNSLDSVSKVIEAQKKSAAHRIVRNEQEMRTQLLLLQDEQRSLEKDTSSEPTFTTGELEDLMQDMTVKPEEVINPYPITFPSICNKNLDNEGSNLKKSGSFMSSSSRNGSVGGDLDNELWVGDPDAISSVRRSQKPCGRQRKAGSHLWLRSKSLKERPISSRSDFSSSSMSRSGSVRGSPLPAEGILMRDALSESNSMISTPASEQSLENLNTADCSRIRSQPRRTVSLKVKGKRSDSRPV